MTLAATLLTGTLAGCSTDSDNAGSSDGAVTYTMSTQEAAPSATKQGSASQQTSSRAAATYQVGGDCGTASDGAVIDVNVATSCVVASAIHDATSQQVFFLQATDPTANKLYHTVVPFAVHSEATGKDYSVQCRLGSDLQTMACEDATGGTAEARFIRNGDS